MKLKIEGMAIADAGHRIGMGKLKRVVKLHQITIFFHPEEFDFIGEREG